MRWLFPWGNFLRISGGTIIGNLTVQGLTNLEDTLTITKDVVGTPAPHIELKPATVAGAYDLIVCSDDLGAFEGALGSDITSSVFLIPAAGGSMAAPVDLFGPDPTWKIPLLATSLGVRRMLMLHSILFG